MGSECRPLLLPVGHTIETQDISQLIAGTDLIVPEADHPDVELFKEADGVIGEPGVDRRQLARHGLVYPRLVNHSAAPSKYEC